ncbi:uncharacterized protein AB675_9278 [Cyphellophora attinorum]|uniref:Hydantoinase/oxoprolinase N-terminal domain-containing protein n=1 Tax=Cyphellophora attinorum TaxID=1664694 RepID=A0A0N1HB20_9EURO|nr:uncharacterized protein AB675_9278 [Phialophora attinorum]KPI41376.1 hypothetical protein AB675_9278 [Phialophora attinorum]
MGSMGAPQRARYRIGVDVGTYNSRRDHWHQRGNQAVVNSSGVSLDDIGCVIIGTTHFVNAVVQRSPDLERVAVVRLCGGSTEGFGLGVPPFVDYPAELKEMIYGGSYFCNGGHQITSEELSPLDESELATVANGIVRDENQ